jgi:pyrimidine deaminase RibD-like protein
MREAIDEAKVAGQAGEVPVGAVILIDGEIVARGINRTLSDNDPSAHAEIVAIRAAAAETGNPRLAGATTLRPGQPAARSISRTVPHSIIASKSTAVSWRTSARRSLSASSSPGARSR